MAAEHPAHGELAIGRIPGSLEMYLITRMTDWDGEMLPGRDRAREDASGRDCYRLPGNPHRGRVDR